MKITIEIGDKWPRRIGFAVAVVSLWLVVAFGYSMKQAREKQERMSLTARAVTLCMASQVPDVQALGAPISVERRGNLIVAQFAPVLHRYVERGDSLSAPVVTCKVVLPPSKPEWQVTADLAR